MSSSGRLAWFSRAAIPVTASLGIRETLDPGTARGAVPVRSALVGSILSIVMVVGTLTFGANLVHLVTTPQLYGQTWQASIDTQFQTIPTSLIHSTLDHRPGVVAWSAGNMGTVDVTDSHVPAIGLSRGVGPLVGPTLVSGRLPSHPGEIALGASVLRSVGRHVGQDLTVGVNGAQRRMHIVGQAVFPAFDQGSFTSTDLGLGAIVTAADLLPQGEPLSDSSVFVLVRFAPGPDQARQVGNFGRASASYCAGVQQSTCFVTSQPPFDVGNYARIEGVPQILAVVLAVLGVAVLVQLMIVWVQRRRREIAILKTIGFVRRQVLSLVAWQSGTFAFLSLLIGIPLGIVVGRGRLGPVRKRAGHRISVNRPRLPHRTVHSGCGRHRPDGRSGPGVDRQSRCSQPEPCSPNEIASLAAYLKDRMARLRTRAASEQGVTMIREWSVAYLPEPVSPRYRSRVRKVSCIYRSQGVVDLPVQHMVHNGPAMFVTWTCEVGRERATGIEPAFSAWEAHE